jgi:Zn-dependent protease with chaperone function
MEDCYKVVFFEHEMLNAFSIGCNVFFSSTLYEEIKFDDNKLRAVIAHEVSHGDRGHGLKTLFAMMESGVKVTSQLLYEEGQWLVKGGESELLNKLAFENIDFLELVIDNFAEKSPAIELDADVHAVKILNNAGYSAQSLIDFLEFIHVVSENTACDQQSLPAKSSVRKYPRLCQRVEAIQSIMSY